MGEVTADSAEVRRRGAFTLPELIVVLVIVAVLLALAASAVQAARERARRLQCQANLRNLGLALHGYHDANGAFPPALSTGAPPRYLSWLARALPYVEQDALWRDALQAARANPWPWANPPHPTDRVVALFTCPDDPRAAAAVVPANIRVGLATGRTTDVRVSVALTSYLGASGTDLRSRDGILFANSRVRATAVTDGLSHTLLVGERPASADLAFPTSTSRCSRRRAPHRRSTRARPTGRAPSRSR
jgi:prepilin-type N-terminal cleavage/methylation domain-containing protein